MKIIELDLTGCKNTRDIHERIRTAFDFPDWYGNNWSAFWDLLWSECDADKVIVKGETPCRAGWNSHWISCTKYWSRTCGPVRTATARFHMRSSAEPAVRRTAQAPCRG